jgi:5-methylcytosine-specific restriction enzyme A
MHLAKKDRYWVLKSEQRKRNPFYDTPRWRKLSKIHKIKYPLCKHCKDKGVTKQVDHTDHILPITTHPQLRYTWSNLQSLCISCHNTKTANEN